MAETLSLSASELKRACVIRQIAAGHCSQAIGAERLGNAVRGLANRSRSIAAHDDVRRARGGQGQVFAVLGVAAFPHLPRRFNPLRGGDDDVEDRLTAFDRNEPVELRAEDDFPIFVLDLSRQDEPVGFGHGAEQRPLRNPVRLEGGRNEGRGVEDDDRANRSVRHAASSASMSASVRPAARASRFASAMASARRRPRHPPFSEPLRMRPVTSRRAVLARQSAAAATMRLWEILTHRPPSRRCDCRKSLHIGRRPFPARRQIVERPAIRLWARFLRNPFTLTINPRHRGLI